MLCCYVNATNQIQIARMINLATCCFERVVFPGQRLLFNAVPGAFLEIQTGTQASECLSCQHLRVLEPPLQAVHD